MDKALDMRLRELPWRWRLKIAFNLLFGELQAFDLPQRISISAGRYLNQVVL